MLDCLINPHWPYLPVNDKNTSEDDDHIERAWTSVPDDPLNYDFFYHVLEGDNNGREPKNNGLKNEKFNAKSKSCLRHLTECSNKVLKCYFVKLAVTYYYKQLNIIINTQRIN